MSSYPARYRPPSRYLRRGGRGSRAEMILGVGIAVVLISGGGAGAAGAVHRPARHYSATHAHPAAPAAPAVPSGNVALGRSLARSQGWYPGREWACLYALWTRESGWQALIMNRSSGAWGIAQALNHGGTAATPPVVRFPDGGAEYGVSVDQYPTAAANRGDPRAQIEWGLTYIRTTYGTPCGAWTHEETNGWY